MKKIFPLAFCLFFSLFGLLAAQEKWTMEKSLDIRSIDALTLSPDAQWLVYSVTGVDRTKNPWVCFI